MRIEARQKRIIIKTVLILLLQTAALNAQSPSPAEVAQMVKEVDERQRNPGDYKALVYLEAKEKDRDDRVYQLVVYRRDLDDRMMILNLKPKSEAGKGYLKIDNNLFFYDPTTGKWDRRTERERINGTNSNRSNYDESRLSEDFDAEYLATEKLGQFDVYHIKLTAKKEADVAYPTVHIWIDRMTGNLLKSQDRAFSGRLMRTSYYPKWEKVFSRAQGKEIYFPKEIRIYDELEKGNSSIIVVQKVDLRDLDPNIFTKAWLESKSR